MSEPENPPATDGPVQPIESRGDNRSQRPRSEAFKEFITTGWGPRVELDLAAGPAAPFTAQRRARLSALFPGERLVVPAGAFKVRNNDCDYQFRPHSAFAHLTGLGTEQEPDAVLVLHPVAAGTGDEGSGHHAVLYFRPLAGRETDEFYTDSRYGEFWVGARPTLADVAALTGIQTALLDALRDALAQDVATGDVRLLVVPGADETIESVVEEIRAAQDSGRRDEVLAETLSELRLIKDAHEIAQMRHAVHATIAGFAKIVRDLPIAVEQQFGERVIEGTFGAHARLQGNAVGYGTIAAAGEHATTLHWTRNDGQVNPGDLVLVDAGVEVDSLYTADVTRTLPVSGKFTDVQRRIYSAVLDAADAAFAVAVPGAKFRDVHTAAMKVIAARLGQWGLLPGTVEESLAPEGQFHRRYMVHGTSHHLGLDVHDCALARSEMYLDGILTPGMVFTIEPGLYFKADDLTVPAEYRGIGVRIEDDVLVTADGNENLSSALPRRPDEVEAWMSRLLTD